MKETEINRQLFHALFGVFFVILISFGALGRIGSFFPLNEAGFLSPLSRTLLFILVIIGILFILLRNYDIPVLDWVLDTFGRSSVRQSFPGKGAFFYGLGAFILSLFLSSRGVAASMLIVSIGDSVSHLIGEEYGEIKHPLSKSKYSEGHIAGGVLAGAGASFFIVSPVAFTAAFISMFIEGIDFGSRLEQVLDDNLIIPLISGIVITLLEPIFV